MIVADFRIHKISIVIQSEAKNLENNVVNAHEILRRFAPLNDIDN